MPQRPFEVVVFGATGFTGQLVARYLAERHPGLRWAIAGRSQEKLAAVRDALAAHDPALSELTLLVADVADPAALREVAEQGTVVASTAGPFARIGSELVAACIDRRTHYCDITGEVQWVDRMVRAHHGAAEAGGVRVVHSCGYDSVPSDLGVLALERHARDAHGEAATEVDALTYLSASRFSGGTFASALNLVEEAARDASVRRVFEDPHALAPDPAAAEGCRAEQRGPGYVAAAGQHTAPSLMAPCNARIVYRTNGLLGFPYGRAFTYREAVPAGSGPRGAMVALALTAGMRTVELGLMAPPLRRALARFAPKPGEGPSATMRAGASFSHELYATLGAKRLRARFAGAGDPAYGETAKMLAESALCLARDGAALPISGGVLTPAAAMGARLIERLRAAGTTISAWTEA